MKRPSTPIVDLRPVLREVVPEFSELTPREQLGLSLLVFRTMSNSREHRHNRSDERVSSFSVGDLRSALGQRNYKEVVLLAYNRPPGNLGCTRGSTKRHVLRAEVEGPVSTYLREVSGLPLIDPRTGLPYRSRHSVMDSAVYVRDINNNPANSKMPPLSPLVVVDVPAIQTYARILGSQLERWTLGHLFRGPCGRKLNYAQVTEQVRVCAVIVAVARAKQGGPDTLVQYYREHRSGRLVGEGMGKGIHLQNVPREIRTVALGHYGLYDWDIDVAHPTALYHLAKRWGYHAGGIREYIENKSEVRRSIAHSVGVPVDAVKSGFTSVFYGVPRSTSPRVSLYRNFGGDTDKVQRFLDHPVVSSLFNERVEARDRVLSNSEYSGGGKLRNMMGREMIVKGAKKWSLLSHVLTGVEACATESGVAAVVASGGLPVLLCFDGWLSSGDVDVDRVQDQIFDRTGVPFTLSRDRVPTPGSLLD